MGGQNKVLLGYLIYMIDEPMKDAMEAIYKIRNLFAHNLDMSFESTHQEMVASQKKLTLHEGLTFFPTPFWPGDAIHPVDPVTDGQSRFIVNLKICLIFLMGDIHRHEPWCNTPKALPDFSHNIERARAAHIARNTRSATDSSND
jgi:hypothetical protein